MVARLVREEQVTFDYFPVRYTGAGAADSVNQAFDKIESHGTGAFDVVVVIGDSHGEADIGVIHRVLAPRISRSPAPVLTALGPDDGKTILGDTACRVFPRVETLAEFLLSTMQERYAHADQALARIRSLGQFLIAEHEVESKILLQAVLQPTLHRHCENLTTQVEETGARLRRIVQPVLLRLMREEAALEQFRARIGVELARIAKNNAATAHHPAESRIPFPIADQQVLKARIDKVRTALLFGYLCLLGVMWWWATPGNAVFFGGSALVVFSASYVAICNRLIDGANQRHHDSYGDDDSTGQPGQTTQGAADQSMFDIPTIDSLDVGRLQKSKRIEPWLK